MNAISQIKKIRDTYEIILENGTILSVSELFVLNFDGTSGISYRNAELNISVDDITVAASLEDETQTILLNQLNNNADGVFYITSTDAARLQLPADFSSTIYVGDTDDLDVLGGAFSGLAETTGAVAVANKADNAFVLTNRIGSVEELAAVIAHEAGHLAGTLTHDYTDNGISIDDFMNHARVVISAGQSCTFTNETFSGLVTTGRGGAILNRGITTITGATFTGNRANSGGAVYNTSSVIISGATFAGNSAYYGGAVFNNYGSVVLTDTAFLTSTDTIYNLEGNLTFGGTITLATQLQNCGQVTITSGTQLVFDLTSCTSSREYIFIKKESDSIRTRISGLDQAIYEVHVNSLQTSAGKYTLFQGGDSTSVSNFAVTVKDGNTTIGGQALRVGDSVAYNGKLYSISGENDLILTINVNYADRIVVHSGESSSFAAGTTYTNPYVYFVHGAVAEVQSGGTFTANNVTFAENSAYYSGGAVYNAGSATFSGATFFENSANSGGGAIYNAGSAMFSGATFIGNRVNDHNRTGFGGAIYNSGSATVNGGTFESNSANSGGGAIYNAGSATISGATFTGNDVANNGGAICNVVSATINISGAIFSENSATSGGAVYNEGSAMITSATFIGNNGFNGGAICGYSSFFNSATYNVNGGSFIGNSANSGGAVYNACSSATISGATFIGNSAYSGGAVFNSSSAALNISGATFAGNRATSGGAVFNYRGTVNLTGMADLQTDTDTWFNGSSSFVNWDLTAGTASYGTIRNFQYYSNADTSVTQKITVGNTQNSGIYTLATGDMSDWDTDNTGKYNFNITGVSGLSDVTITVGGTQTYNGLTCKLNIDNNGTPDVSADDKLLLTLDNTTGFINTSYTGAPGSTTSDGHIVGIDAFTRFDAAIDAGKTNLIQTGGTYGNGSTVAIFTAQGNTLTVQTAAYNTNTILAGGKHSNTAASGIWVYESGSTNLTIDAGTFQGNVIGADVCTSGSQQRTGDVNMTIHGGNFTTTVAGGMYYRSSTHGTTLEQKLNSVCLIGNVNLTIDGGSFNKRVYGGNYASTDNWGGQTLLDGSINLTIDASDAITFSEHVIAGSRGTGWISGDVNVTVTGNGANLNFANGKYLFGASGLAYYKTSGGVRSEVSYVDGTRNLVFNDFQGQFSGKIGMFQKITFSGDTQMSFKASQNVSLSDISSWELNWDGDVETYADLTGVTNTFAGDTVNINFDSASTDDALLTGAAGAFASLTSATVKFNDTQVAFDDAANGWVSGSNKLYISDDGTQLKMTTIA